MGTAFTVDAVFSDVPEDDALATTARGCQQLHDIDAVFSTWREISPISLLRVGKLTVADMPSDVPLVLAACESARELSGGWFDPWAAPGGIDPTGYVKGWAGQQVLETLRAAGAVAALVNAAGDVVGFGEPEPGRPWRLGLTNPFSTHLLLGVVSVVDCALAVSGTYERGEHIYDPHGGPSAAGVISAAVIGPDLGIADALATALVAGGARAFEHVTKDARYEALVIFSDGRRLLTEPFARCTPWNGSAKGYTQMCQTDISIR